MTQNTLNPCAIPYQEDPILDQPPKNCDPLPAANLRTTPARPDLGWNQDDCEEIRDGVSGVCDPLLAGRIVNDPERDNRDVIYRYSRALRGCDEAMLDLFRDVVLLSDEGKAFNVPVIWGTQEVAIQALLADNVRKDHSLVIDRVRLPAMAIYRTGIQYNANRYIYHKAMDFMREFRPSGAPGFTAKEKYPRDTVFGVSRGFPLDMQYKLTIWAMFINDFNYILESILGRFDPLAYIKVRGVGYETVVKIDSIAENPDVEPGDGKMRVLKTEFNLTAETWLPKPISRFKSVLRTRMEILDGLTEEDAIRVIDRIDEVAKDENVFV